MIHAVSNALDPQGTSDSAVADEDLEEKASATSHFSDNPSPRLSLAAYERVLQYIRDIPADAEICPMDEDCTSILTDDDDDDEVLPLGFDSGMHARNKGKDTKPGVLAPAQGPFECPSFKKTKTRAKSVTTISA